MSGYPVAAPAVKTAVAILAAALPAVPVMTKLPYPAPGQPDDTPALFVRVTRVGGGRPLLVTDTARILIEVWALTVADAEDTANQAIAALQNSQGTTTASGVFSRGFDNIEGPVDFPDPQISNMERWQFQGDLLLSTS